MDPAKIVRSARCIVPAAAERFGSQPFREPVEELRLKLIETCTKILHQAASELSYERSHPITDILAFSLVSALTDRFPEGKRAAATAISTLCQIALPKLGRICMDRSKKVRVCFARSLGVWLVRGLDCITVAEEAIGKSPGALHEFASDLLALLFMLLSDESREVAAMAVSELNAVGIHWQLATSKSISKWCVAELPLPCVPSVLPRDFACNAAYLVSSAATTLVTLHFQPILNI